METALLVAIIQLKGIRLPFKLIKLLVYFLIFLKEAWIQPNSFFLVPTDNIFEVILILTTVKWSPWGRGVQVCSIVGHTIRNP